MYFILINRTVKYVNKILNMIIGYNMLYFGIKIYDNT